ncbi:MAG: DUF6562 domain-containing protein [Bacteroidales bacterium]
MKMLSIFLLLYFIFLAACVEIQVIDEDKKKITLALEFPKDLLFNKKTTEADQQDHIVSDLIKNYQMELLYEVYDKDILISRGSYQLGIDEVFNDKKSYLLDIFGINPQSEFQILFLLYFIDSEQKNKIYNIHSLKDIEIDSANFSINTICKEIYTGILLIDESISIDDTLNTELHSPFAHYKIFVNDLSEYLEETGKSDQDSILLKVTYPDYYLSSFNILRQEPIRANRGYTFSTWMKLDDELLFFDYLFVQGDTSKTRVRYDIMKNSCSSDVENSYRPIEISYTKNESVIFRSNYLTSFKESGIIVNPDFEGDYNINF